MKTTPARIIAGIAEFNNQYRDRSRPVSDRLVALWMIGDYLVRIGVRNPHALGWAIQRESRGLIKRPTIFRSYKIRSIWPGRDAMIRDIGGLRGLSVVTELLPLLDPAQLVRSRLSSEDLSDLLKHAKYDSAADFKNYVRELKTQFAHGRLGTTLDRSKHLTAYQPIADAFKRLIHRLQAAIRQESMGLRRAFCKAVPAAEISGLSNMCIALTTKENVRFYRRSGPTLSAASIVDFATVYEAFRGLLELPTDVERARLRRLISAESLATASDLLSSVSSERGVSDFWERQRLAVPLPQ